MKKRELGRLSRASWRLIVPIAVIIIGCATLLLTKAAQPIARIEAESGTRSSNVQLISNDSSASGNSAVLNSSSKCNTTIFFQILPLVSGSLVVSLV